MSKRSWIDNIRAGSMTDYVFSGMLILLALALCGAAIYFTGYSVLAFVAWAYNTAAALVWPARRAITPWQALAAMIAFTALSVAFWRIAWGLARVVRHALGR